MKKKLVIFLCFFCLCCHSQSLSKLIVNATIDTSCVAPKSKSYFKFKSKKTYFNPIAYVGSSLLFTYQKLLSPQIQASCMYAVSCSEYTRLSILKNGFFLGTLKGFNQLSECFDGAFYEHAECYQLQNKINNEED